MHKQNPHTKSFQYMCSSENSHVLAKLISTKIVYKAKIAKFTPSKINPVYGNL